ncbi:MAG: MFS transporter [Synergistes sp.]|nr:MFS transporter [Synergistes sp.]
MPGVRSYIRNYFIYGLLAFSYFLACMLRTSGGIIFPDVSNTVKLTSAAIGLVSGMYFYGYTLIQPFSGTLCDRKGPLLIESLFLFMFAAGLYLFAVAENTFMLCAARFLIGLGAGPTFSGILVYQAKAFPDGLYSKLTGATVTLGHLGGVVSITPLGWAVDRWGYRNIHMFLAAVTFLVAASLYFLKGSYRSDSAAEERKLNFLRGFAIISRSRPLRTLLLLWVMGMLLHLNLMGLWGVIWIQKVSGAAVGHARLCMSSGGVGVLIGAVLCGIFGNSLAGSQRYIRSSCAALCAFLLVLTICIELKCPWLIFLTVSFFLGIVIGAVNVMCNIFAYRIVGSDDIGTAIGAANLVIFLSVLLSQWFSGAFIHFYDKHIGIACISPYAVFFLIICVLLLITLSALCRTPLVSDAE